MAVELQGITKSYGDNTVLDSVDLSIKDNEFVSLIGPSGVGKTTLLKILAGMETRDSGIIRFSEDPGKDRPVIMVFQDFALFPHMSIVENVSYGLKVRGMKKPLRLSKAMEILDWFGIGAKALDYPARLSAGQKQRAAIARALIVEPMILLLDEPFANLDKNLKGETARFIRDTQQSFGTTTVMVTHDQDEAFAVSDRVGVIIGGTIRQFDHPDNLITSPADRETAEFLGRKSELSIVRDEGEKRSLK